jgi:hypothetical protein
MSEFVGDQSTALHRSRCILTRRKRDIAPKRKGPRIDALRRCARCRVVVNAHTRKVMPKAGFEIGPQIGSKGHTAA